MTDFDPQELMLAVLGAKIGDRVQIDYDGWGGPGSGTGVLVESDYYISWRDDEGETHGVRPIDVMKITIL